MPAVPQPTAKLIAFLEQQIRDKIVRGEFRPGDMLKQTELATMFSVSRTPIREALSRLEAQGVIRQDARRSAVIAHPSSRDVIEIYRIRAELEGLAAELAARFISDADLARLEAIHSGFETAVAALHGKEVPVRPSTEAWISANEEFHQVIAEASGNQHLARMLRDLRGTYTRTYMAVSAAGASRTRLAANIRHHAEILAAIRSHEPALSRAAMAGHVLESGEYIVTQIATRS